MLNRFHRLPLAVVSAISISFTWSLVSPVRAAERLELQQPNQGTVLSISVADLGQFTKTGHVSEALASTFTTFALSPESQVKFKHQLNRPISISSNPGDLDIFEAFILEALYPQDPARQQEFLQLLSAKGNGKVLVDFLADLPTIALSAANTISVLTAYTPESIPKPIPKTAHILYLNSTRGHGTGFFGSYRSAIAGVLENYQNGHIFDVDFVQTHMSGDLAFWLTSKPTGYYDQIWFDTTILQTALLNGLDLDALNGWAAHKQPEFILDTSFFYRQNTGSSISASASAVTINQALALQKAGGGIFIGTDGDIFAYTANQILTNFGFDQGFADNRLITENGAFVGDLLLNSEPVADDFYLNHLQGLSTSRVPIGKHQLNANGDNRQIEIYENLYSLSPTKIAHIGSSFDTGKFEIPLDRPQLYQPKSTPEPSILLSLSLILGLAFVKRQTDDS